MKKYSVHIIDDREGYEEGKWTPTCVRFEGNIVYIDRAVPLKENKTSCMDCEWRFTGTCTCACGDRGS